MAVDTHAPGRPPARLGLRTRVRWLRRPRSGPSAGADPVAEPDAAPVPARLVREETPRTLEAAPLLVERLRWLGHTAWLEDRVAGAVLPDGLSAAVFGILDDYVEAIARRGRPGQTLSIRLRVEDGALVASIQNGGTLRVDAPDLEDADLQPLRRRIERAGGDATVLPTANGYWIAIARFPLDG